MDTIINYIENLFVNYPQTPELIRAKEDLLNLMEDKYNVLKEEGRTENEAIGIVISEFGNIDELISELGIYSYSAQKNQEDNRQSYRMGIEDAKSFLFRKQVFGQKVGLGVALCILSPVAAGIMEILSDMGFILPKIAEAAGGAFLFAIVAVAVAIFITSGLKNNQDEELDKKRIILDNHTRSYVTGIYNAYLPAFSTKTVTGVVFLIVSIIPGAVTSELFDDTFLWWISELASLTLFLFAATGVFCLITAGVRKGSMELLLGKGDYSEEKIRQKEHNLTGIIASIYWPVVTAVYLAWSFLTNDWGITWIIWPVTGVLFGGIAAVCSVVENSKKA